MNKDTLVSVVIPVFNRADRIRLALQSIQAQTYADWEAIVVDDGSSDGSAEVVDSLAHAEPRIRLIRHEKNKGAQAARNTGIRASRGEWIAFLDSDDEWLPQRLEAGLSLAQKTSVSVVHSECYIKNDNNNELKIFGISHKSGNLYKNLLKHPGPMYQGLLVKKESLERIGYLDETILSYQEWDTTMRLAQYYKFEFVETPLFIYHCHKDETISKDMKRDADGWAQIVEKNRKEIFEVAGREALNQHYIILARKYYSVGKFEVASKYYLRLSELSTGYSKMKYILQSLLVKNRINPDILNFVIFRYIIHIFKMIFRIIHLRSDTGKTFQA